MADNTLDREIQDMLSSTDAPSAARVAELSARYPYFTLPAMLLFKRGGSMANGEERDRIIRTMALNSPDAMTMRMAMDPGNSSNFYPPAPDTATHTTEDTIDKFLSTYGSIDPREEELLTRMIFNPVPDYAQQLAREEELSVPEASTAPVGSQDSLINDFIIKSRAADGHFPSATSASHENDKLLHQENATPNEPTKPLNRPERTDDTMLSESLAKMYIAQHRYGKAYEIISNLNLNFPEKSIYFADQLRFLRKLMFIQEHSASAQSEE